MALPRPEPRLTLLPGGPGHGPAKIVGLREDLEEGWLEARVAGEDLGRYAGDVLRLARRIQEAVYAGKRGLVAQYAHELELAAPHAAGRGRRVVLEADRALAALNPDRPA